jgi:RNA polymerase sigma-70 factor (ECF subfamily)
VGKLIYIQDDAADVAQEVVLTMYSSISKLRSPEAFRSWMYRLIETSCIRHNSKSDKRRNNVDIGDYENTIADEVPDTQPAEVAETNETNHIVQTMIDELPEKQRLALFMYYFEDMSYRQIAKALGITIGTVSTNIMKARTTLKKRMKKKNIFPEKSRKLDGVGLLIVSALEADFASTVTTAQAEALIHACGEHIAHTAASHIIAGQTAAKASAGGLKLGVVVPATVSVTLGATAVVGQIVGGQYVPDATINFAGAETPTQTNPSSASLLTDDGTPLTWRIVDEADNQVASGEGSEIDQESLNLPPGEYIVEWIVSDGKGQTATVRRDMSIT